MAGQFLIRNYWDVASVGKIVKRRELGAQSLMDRPICVRYLVRVFFPFLKTKPDVFFIAATLDEKSWNLALICQFNKSMTVLPIRKRCVNNHPIAGG